MQQMTFSETNNKKHLDLITELNNATKKILDNHKYSYDNIAIKKRKFKSANITEYSALINSFLFAIIRIRKTKETFIYELLIKDNSINKVEIQGYAEIKHYETFKDFKCFVFADENIKDYINSFLKITDYAVENYSPEYHFDCCHRYESCSDNKKCMHPNLLYAKNCSYRLNLENGRIFYGKNKNF